MAPKAKTKPEDQKEEKAVVDSAEVLGAFLEAKENKGKHLNFVVKKEYLVSTGSLIWDIESGGGLPPGLHRFSGPPESGKSSAALEVCRNFLAMHPQGRGIYIDAEGKLTAQLKARCGLKFVFKASEWVDGTIFVLETNNYDFVANLLRTLVMRDEQPNLFCIIFDSMDALLRDGDKDKSFDENVKVAGGPLLSKQFLQRTANYMTKHGHLVIMLSQFSTNISLDKYAAADSKRSKQGGGGWGAAHFANFAFTFQEAYGKDFLRPNMDSPQGPANQAFGKTIKIKFTKSTNEKTNSEISYPVKYGVKGKSAVWREMEIIDALAMCGILKTNTAWIEIPEYLASELKEGGFKAEVPAKVNGRKKLLSWMEANPSAVEILSNYLCSTMNAATAPAPTNEAKEAELD